MLDMTRSQPGLIDEAGAVGSVLSLENVLARGRSDIHAFSAESLVSCELRADRVVATYHPIGWSELEVRATWSALSEFGMGLELQVTTRSVGALQGIEIGVGLDLNPAFGKDPKITVIPRDAQSAQMTYDGREGNLNRVITHEVKPATVPVRWSIDKNCSINKTHYVSMCFCEDVSRSMYSSSKHGSTLRSDRCFGHDLERGVVLRARLRGLWLPDEGIETRAEAEALAFANEPLPLGT